MNATPSWDRIHKIKGLNATTCVSIHFLENKDYFFNVEVLYVVSKITDDKNVTQVHDSKAMYCTMASSKYFCMQTCAKSKMPCLKLTNSMWKLTSLPSLTC